MLRNLLMAVLCVFLFITLAFMINTDTEKEQGGLERSIEALSGYQETYVGDNSQVGAILHALPLGDQVVSLRLQTQTEPYGIQVYYALDNMEKSITAEDMEQLFTYNATAIYAVVSNVENLTFEVMDMPEALYTVDRKHIDSQYDKALKDILSDPDSWKQAVIVDHLNALELIMSYYE